MKPSHMFAAAVLACFAAAPAPATVWHVDRRHPDAADANLGLADQPFKTINKAAQVARPGDTVLIGGGVYREHVWPQHAGRGPNAMITYAARDDEHVAIKGSNLWQPQWTKVELEGVNVTLWQARLDPVLFTYDFPVENFNPFHQSPLRIYSQTAEDYYAPVRPVEAGKPLGITRGAIFLDGRPIGQITDPKAFNSSSNVFLVPADGESVLVRMPLDRPPHGLTFEIVTREQCFAPRALRVEFIKLKNLHFEHAANGNGVPQMGMVSMSRGRNWIFEDCSFRWAGTCGLDVGEMAWYHPPAREGNYGYTPQPGDAPGGGGELEFTTIIRRCVIADNGTVGVWSYGGGRSQLVEDCIFERNNRLGRNTWEEAGIKCHGNTGTVIRNNLFRDNDSYAVWFDGPWGNNRVTQNLFISNMNAGVFIEAEEQTTLIDNNICIFTRPFTFRNMTQADGIYGHETSNLIAAHNLCFGNAGYGIRLIKLSASHQQPYPESIGRVSQVRLFNNIVYANGRGAVSLTMPQRLSSDNIARGNFYWDATDLPQFELQRGVMQPQKMVAVIEQAIGDAGVSPHQAPMLDQWKSGRLHPMVGEMMHNGPLVGLPLWQKVQGLDQDAVVGPLPVLHMYRDGRMKVHLNVGEGLAEPNPEVAEGEYDPRGNDPAAYARLDDVKCEPVEYVTHDYFGQARPKDRPPTVGPIQGLAERAAGEREQWIQLWPNASADRPPAKDLRIDIKPLPFRSVKNEGEWVQP